MGRKRKLTHCLPVVKHAGQRATLVKGENDQQKPGGGKAKRKTVQNEKGTGDVSTSKISTLEKLVQFDLNWQFGPCTGITRFERWQRAQDLGLMPPQDIKQILLAHSSDPQYQHNLWNSYAI